MRSERFASFTHKVLMWANLIIIVVLFGISCVKLDNRALSVSVHRPKAEAVTEKAEAPATFPPLQAQPATLGDAVFQVRLLETPRGVPRELFDELKNSLVLALIERDVLKFPQKPPSADPNNGISLNASASDLTWNEARWGDWNNDGYVSAQDLSPLALNFGKTDNVADPNYYKYGGYIDGNRDHTVNAGDLTPIAFHFGESTGGYNIYEANDSSGTGSIKVAEILRYQVPDDTQNPPFNKSFETLQYDTSTGAINPAGWAPIPGKWYRVTPFDATPLKGESTTVSSSWVELPPPNQPPTAVAGANPTTGSSPLAVSFSALGSDDPDGSIVLYEWDFQGDGVYDWTNSSSGDVQFTYDTEGSYTPTLRVTDNDGGSAASNIPITVYPRYWAHTWGGTDIDVSTALALDGNGNIFAAGRTQSFSASSFDTLLVKYDSFANAQWAKTWGGDGEDNGYALRIDSSGNPILAGSTTSSGAGNEDVLLLKYDNDGNLLWSKTWGGSNHERPIGMAIEGNDNVVTAGSTMSFGAGSTDALLMEFGSAGNLFWARTWGTANEDYLMSVAIDGSGNILATGLTAAFGGGYNLLLLKLDGNGNLLWAESWGTNRDEWGRNVMTDSSGNIYVAGAIDPAGNGLFDALLVKFDSSGNLIWTKGWGGNNNERGENLALDQGGNLAVVGWTWSFAQGDDDLLLLKYDSGGNLLSSKAWGTAERDEGFSLTIDNAGDLIISGFSSYNTGSWQAVTGTEWSPIGILSVLTGTTTSPIGATGSPTGTEVSPVGVIDTGAGNGDLLIVKTNP